MEILKNTNCMVTGASRGLGARIATAFWEAGASLLLVGRDRQRLREVVAGLSARGDQRVITYRADLGDPTAPERIVAEARRVFGRLQLLINNAAAQGPIGPLWDNSFLAWEETLRVNLLSPVAICRLCVPWMAQHGGGRIVNISGGGATAPRPNFSAYATAKAGLVRFSETLAEETRRVSIQVNCVAPGAMSTGMLTAILEAGPAACGGREYEAAAEAKEAGEDSIERAAALCLFLASEASEGITGRLISAVWDPWETLRDHLEELRRTDVYTLRRIVPRDRGLDWGGA